MKTFIKLLAVLLVATMAFSFGACDKNAEEIEALEKEIADLEDEIADLEDELKEAKEDDDEDEIEKLEEEIEEKKADLEELEDELDELKDDSKKDDDKDDKKNGKDSDVEKVVEDYFEAMYAVDVKGMLECTLDPFAIAYYMDEEDLDDEDEVFDFFEGSNDFDGFTEQEAEIEIDEIEDMDEDDFEELVETLVDDFDYDEDAIEGAKIVTVSATLKVEGEKISAEMEETVVCIDGDWYVLSRGILAESVATEASYKD